MCSFALNCCCSYYLGAVVLISMLLGSARMRDTSMKFAYMNSTSCVDK